MAADNRRDTGSALTEHPGELMADKARRTSHRDQLPLPITDSFFELHEQRSRTGNAARELKSQSS